jgi:hypothetical protein
MLHEQQQAHQTTFNAAKATYEELGKLRSQVETEVAAIKGQAEGQEEAVSALTKNITTALEQTWSTFEDKLKEDTQKIIDAATAEFDAVKSDLVKLHSWTNDAIKQEQRDRMDSCEVNKDAVEALSRSVQSLRQKTRDVANTRRERRTTTPEDQMNTGRRITDLIDRAAQRTSAPPPPPPLPLADKKEPRNLPLPAKFDGNATKLKEFISKVESTFERMPLTYSSTNDKILFVADLLTGGAYTWYSANEHKRSPDPQSGFVEWDTYGRFKKDLVEVHQNLHEAREAKTALKKEFQKKGELMKDFIARVRVLQLVADFSKEQLWEHLVDSILPEVRTHLRRVSTDKDVLDKVPQSVEMCFQTILNAGSTVEFEKAREAFAQNQYQQKVQQVGGHRNEKKESTKPVDKGKKEDSLESRISKPKQKKKVKTSAKSSDTKPATKREKEPGEDKVSQSVRKDRMTNRQCIKCGQEGHMKADCTNGWKPPALSKGKGKEKAEVKVVAAKVSAIKATVEPAPEPIQYGRILDLEEDELDYEWED